MSTAGRQGKEKEEDKGPKRRRIGGIGCVKWKEVVTAGSMG